ncbi:hypothetical protein [Micromonospora sp. NBS 11-29]|uniref:hypothetical protein n=1 Tax=Micromonospora sp. NBS 11-29 TaxID=1960879 RepID=UPI00112094D3|nr:hypothetical protein [Micromonospora sp. NBS 11-29]
MFRYRGSAIATRPRQAVVRSPAATIDERSLVRLILRQPPATPNRFVVDAHVDRIRRQLVQRLTARSRSVFPNTGKPGQAQGGGRRPVGQLDEVDVRDLGIVTNSNTPLDNL